MLGFPLNGSHQHYRHSFESITTVRSGMTDRPPAFPKQGKLLAGFSSASCLSLQPVGDETSVDKIEFYCGLLAALTVEVSCDLQEKNLRKYNKKQRTISAI